ncbi:MAG: PilZ domain-containing protein [Oligoflexia bacterium]|nr:PilZ domain-containing protein [Oligoflexia bacterium]
MDLKKEWFLPPKNEEINNEIRGPFSTETILKLVVKGDLKLDDHIWGPHLETRWHRIFNVTDFQELLSSYPKSQIPKQKSRGISYQKYHVDFSKAGTRPRRYPRVPFNARAIIHNQVLYHHSHCMDISERGVFLRSNNVYLFDKGEEVIVTIRNAPNIGTFSSPSTVIRIEKDPPNVGYGICFLRLCPQVKRKIASYVFEYLEPEIREETTE